MEEGGEKLSTYICDRPPHCTLSTQEKMKLYHWNLSSMPICFLKMNGFAMIGPSEKGDLYAATSETENTDWVKLPNNAG